MKAARAQDVPRSAKPVREEWERLIDRPPSRELFSSEQTDALPAPARRWLTHAIADGTPLATAVVLRMQGHIRLGGWRTFSATQVLAPPHGFIWAATAKVAGMPVTGFDRYSSGSGEMRWRLAGLVPVMSSGGPDVTRSAAGRGVSEGTVFVPTAFPLAQWEAGGEPGCAVATWRIGDDDTAVHLRVGENGRLVSVALQRWGNPDGQPFAYYPFGVTVESERAFNGIRIPDRFRAGWWWGTEREAEGEFFRATITDAVFR